MNLDKFSDDQLLVGLENEFSIERKVSRNILHYLKVIHSRRLAAKRGYSNLFEMLIKHFRQSETSANQRLKALELMLAVPVVEEKLLCGNLSMSVVAMAQRQIKREEKLSGQKLSGEKKAEIVESITGKTMAQTEIELFKQLPQTMSDPQTFERRISETMTRMNLNVPDDVREMMARLQGIWGHVDSNMDPVEVMRRAFVIALEKVDPSSRQVKQCATESVKHRGTDRLTYYGKEFDRALWERAGSRCEFVDPVTGRRCECTFALQREHVIPLAQGGTNELSNMQLLCRPHNLFRARMWFGDRKMDSYIPRSRDRAREL